MKNKLRQTKGLPAQPPAVRLCPDRPAVDDRYFGHGSFFLARPVIWACFVWGPCPLALSPSRVSISCSSIVAAKGRARHPPRHLYRPLSAQTLWSMTQNLQQGRARKMEE